MSDYDSILRETLLRHFGNAQICEGVIDTCVAGLQIECWVNGVQEFGDTYSASIFFLLSGGKLGETPVFASVSGYGDTAEEAIVTGGCNWACTFGPVLVAGVTGTYPDEAETFTITAQDKELRVVVDGLDRGLLVPGREDENGTIQRISDVRAHFGGQPLLMKKLIASNSLAMLPTSRVSILSLFVSETESGRVVEVKVNGCNWPASQTFLDEIPAFGGAGAALLREFAVVVPVTASSPSRELIGKTLAGLGEAIDDEGTKRNLVAWLGWEFHGGVLGDPASISSVEEFEKKGVTLPKSYREFVLEVQEAGIGPGYGLISPFGDAQSSLARGEFMYLDGQEPSVAPSGCILLAHAGCGIMWLLVVSGKHRGEVWVDAVGADGIARKISDSFEDWFQDWIDGLVRNDSVFSQWDASYCATPATISSFLNAKEAEGVDSDAAMEELAGLPKGCMSVAAVGGHYFEHGANVDPCQSCVELTLRVGMGPGTFKAGVIPKQASLETKKGFLTRLAEKLRK